MEIKDLQANTGKVDIVAEVVNKDEPRPFEKFGKQGKVCNAMLKDGSGEVKMTLWNDDVDSVNVGDKVHLSNGWCSEFRGEKQVSSGKFGKIEVMEKSEQSSGSNELFTNDPKILNPQMEMPNNNGEEFSDDNEENVLDVEEEDLVE